MDANQTSQDSRDDLVPDKTVIVVMGVAGVGKATIARLLAQDLGWKQTEADDLHNPWRSRVALKSYINSLPRMRLPPAPRPLGPRSGTVPALPSASAPHAHQSGLFSPKSESSSGQQSESSYASRCPRTANLRNATVSWPLPRRRA
jgi:hypothetical protein